LQSAARYRAPRIRQMDEPACPRGLGMSPIGQVDSPTRWVLTPQERVGDLEVLVSKQQDDGNVAADASPDVDHGRRAAIAKMGGIAAPALVMLLTTDASEAWSASGRPSKPKPPKPKARSRRAKWFK